MKKRVYIWYVWVVLSVGALAIYVGKLRKVYERDKQITHIVTQYAQQHRQQWSGDNIAQELELPADASPELTCLAAVLAGKEGEENCIERLADTSTYDKWTLALIQGVELRKQAAWTGELLSGYIALKKATTAFKGAPSTSRFGAIAWFKQSNAALADASRYAIAVDFLIRYGDLLQHQAENLLVTLQDVIDRLYAIQAHLNAINPVTPNARICVEQLQKAMSTSMHTTTNLKSFVQQKRDQIKPYIRSCLPSPYGCMDRQEQRLGSMATGFAALQIGIEEYVNIYDELLAWLLQDSQKTLEDLCTGKSKIDNNQAGDAIEQWINSLSQQEGGQSDSGDLSSWSTTTGGDIPKDEWTPRDIKHKPFNKDEQRYLEEIYDRQRQYLEQRQELQKEPWFSPKSLLYDLFEEFYGSEEEFE